MKNSKPLGVKNYGSIPHLLGSKLGKTDKYVQEGQHKILTDKTRDRHDKVIVTEKYDGSNVGIAKKNGKIIAITRSGYLAKTSPYKQHLAFSDWVDQNKNRFRFIDEGCRLSGEWLYQVHSIEYIIKKEPFIAFDYFYPLNVDRMPYEYFLQDMNNYDIQHVRIIYSGFNSLSIEKGMSLLNEYNDYPIMAKELPEGLVYRVERKGKLDFLAKYVRQSHESGKHIIDVPESEFKYNFKL